MTHTRHHATPTRSIPEWGKAAAIGIGAALIGALFAMAFLWPITTAKPQSIELAIVGPDEAVAAIEQKVTLVQPDLFDIFRVDSRDNAVMALERREASGAIVLGSEGIEMLTASAGGPQIAQVLGQMATGLQAQGNPEGSPAPITVTDVVPAGSTAAAANLTMIPALIAGLSGSIIALFVVKKSVDRFATLIAAAATAGLAGSAVLGPWFGILAGNYWMQALGIGAGTLAIGATITGLGSLLGRAGIGMGAVLIVLFANPWGGAMMPTEFLQQPWGTIGSYMPNGTLINLLKSISFFPEASTSAQWWTLAAWMLAGLAMLATRIVLDMKNHAEDKVKPNER